MFSSSTSSTPPLPTPGLTSSTQRLSHWVTEHSTLLAIASGAAGVIAGAGYYIAEAKAQLKIIETDANKKIDIMKVETEKKIAEADKKIDIIKAEAEKKIEVIKADAEKNIATNKADAEMKIAVNKAEMKKELSDAVLNIVFHGKFEKYRKFVEAGGLDVVEADARRREKISYIVRAYPWLRAHSVGLYEENICI